ncbi:unnamed protein product [Sphenostylis stenocarpa]|uniref:Secreted protein n=1 Tax=Sphenostylis stenocarpa TaxID=92480 RepID=A0AA86SHQ0_9FABA|nr:unnamed protein product [Sphenostylis stenocarpa]
MKGYNGWASSLMVASVGGPALARVCAVARQAAAVPLLLSTEPTKRPVLQEEEEPIKAASTATAEHLAVLLPLRPLHALVCLTAIERFFSEHDWTGYGQ